MTDRRTAAWVATGIGVGVALGTATHALALWICIGTVAGAAIGAMSVRRSRSMP